MLSFVSDSLNLTIDILVIIIHAGEKPELKDVFRMLFLLASHWKNIGTLLGVSQHILNRIQRDEDGVNDCLRVMLSERLEQVDAPLTWKDLADAVDVIDKQKAKEIRGQCVDI